MTTFRDGEPVTAPDGDREADPVGDRRVDAVGGSGDDPNGASDDGQVGGSEADPDAGRRRVLATAGAAGAFGLAGCTSLFGDGDDGEGDDGPPIGQIGSDRQGRGAPGGTPMAEMPPLEGELMVYSGRGQFLVDDLVQYIDDQYDDLSLTVRYGGSTDLVNTIVNEGQGSAADVFYSVNAGALGALADEGRTQALPGEILEMVRGEFRTEQWIGTSGRARTVPYNTDAHDAADLPDDVMAYPEGFDGDLGWAPSYGSCQAFVTAMRILEGESTTREWLEAVVDAGIRDYPNEFVACRGVADGEVDAAFANHYYVQRVLEARSGASIDTAFTSDDAGAVFNVAGAVVVDTASDADLAANFVRHLLSAEAQDYFARTTFEYPLIPEVDPVGDLPGIDELDVPDVDLARLSELEETIDLMREAGVEV